MLATRAACWGASVARIQSGAAWGASRQRIMGSAIRCSVGGFGESLFFIHYGGADAVDTKKPLLRKHIHATRMTSGIHVVDVSAGVGAYVVYP